MDFVMQLLGSASIAGIVSGVVNASINDKRIRADIISKSRIDWIQAVRKSSAEYITELHKLIMIGKSIQKDKMKLKEYEVIVYEEVVDVPTDYSEEGYVIAAQKVTLIKTKYDCLTEKQKQQVDEIRKNLELNNESYNNQINNVIEKNAHLRMYFSSKKLKDNIDTENDIKFEDKDYEENHEHIEIKNKLLELKNVMNEIFSMDPSENDEYKRAYDMILNFSENMSDYLKKEWDRAKLIK